MAFKTRTALMLISIAVVGLELSLMRVLALRFWHHFAAMVIGVALLGFGSSGTALSLLQSRLLARRPFYLVLFCFSAAPSVLICAWAVPYIPLDVHFLAWNIRHEILHILEIECLLMVPFFFTGAFVCLALMDRPAKLHGHYAANLVGSGIGAVLAVALMAHLGTVGLIIFWAFLCYAAGLCLIDWHRIHWVPAAGAVGLILLVTAWTMPSDIPVSPYKKLALETSKPDTHAIYAAETPLGRMDMISGPAIHDAPPGMSLMNPHPIPERRLLIVDGDRTHIVYQARSEADWRFLDYATTALPFYLRRHAEVLIVGPGGGAPLALARRHESQRITALEANRRLVRLVRRQSPAVKGGPYDLPGVEVRFEGARSYLSRSPASYDLILIPLLDPAGAAGAGLHAAQENYLYTVEALAAFLGHLKPSGMLCVNVYAKIPPRDGLRLFNLAVGTLRLGDEDDGNAHRHLALIRSWETVTLLVAKSPLSAAQCRQIREFCERGGFDLCYLPDIKPGEANRYHVLPEPYYFQGAKALLGPERETFLDRYLFALDAPTDDRPYFDNFMRWRRLTALKQELKGRLPAFLELGSLLLAIAFLQVVVLAAGLLLVPLMPRSADLIREPGRVGTLLYFFLVGCGFMLLEIGFLQKMILYLGHPIYSAAGVIASFLVFGGLGSLISERWSRRPVIGVLAAGCLAAAIAACYLVFLDAWLQWSQSRDWTIRFMVVFATIAPLAFAMGHLFPIGLRLVGEGFPALIPWSWASNAFASVMAAAGAPLAAMSIGFSRLVMVAMGCYLAAAWLFWRQHGKYAASAYRAPKRRWHG